MGCHEGGRGVASFAIHVEELRNRPEAALVRLEGVLDLDGVALANRRILPLIDRGCVNLAFDCTLLRYLNRCTQVPRDVHKGHLRGFLLRQSVTDGVVMHSLRRILRRFLEMLIGRLEVVLRGYRLAVP